MPVPSPAELADLVSQLTDDELVSLLAGADTWHTAAVPRLGIPALRLSDGPNGVRGTAWGEARSACFPCGAALAATWDPELAERVGREMAAEAHAKGAAVVLGPTVNLARTPIGGRNFECFGEDPLLTARLAVAWITGLQAGGVAACVKHFVANDTEVERMTVSVEVDDRTLREVYLRPFEAAVREARVRAVMASYNRIHGTYSADSRSLLTGVLRDEWGFDGLVMSDWFGLHSTVEGIDAGLDLEMPGPPRQRGARLAAALEAGTLGRSSLERSARRVLDLVAWCGWPVAGHGPETTRDDPGTRALLRGAAARSMVLCRNDGVLPLEPGRLRRVAIVGPDAEPGAIHGGGSAQVRPEHRVSPLAGLRAALTPQGVEVVHEPGCRIDARLPAAGGSGLEARWVDDHGAAVSTRALRRTTFMATERPSGATVLELRGTVELPAGASSFSLVSTGGSRLWVDGELVVDNLAWTPGEAYFGNGSTEVVAVLDHPGGSAALRAAHPPAAAGGVTPLPVGWLPPHPPDALERAVAAAAGADVAVVVVGTTHEWETEGHDRATMDLPGRQDELVRAVAAANPRTVVVVNAGSPVTMDWVDDVAAVVYAFFPGQELGDALADVLCGAVEPTGRLPVTVPVRLADTPAYLDHPGPGGTLRYGEGVFVGHRWYSARDVAVRFPFGHGLAYTTFALDDLAVSGDLAAGTAVATVAVTNRGDRPGRAVVQCYVAPPPEQRWRPRVLAGFAAVELAPGAAATVTVALDRRAAQVWRDGWRTIPGTYTVHAGRSAGDLPLAVTLDVAAEP